MSDKRFELCRHGHLRDHCGRCLRAEVERLKLELAAETASADAEHANLVRVADKYRAREDDLKRAIAAERLARELLSEALPLLSVGDLGKHHAAAIAAFLAPAPGTPEPATTPDTGETR